MRLQNELQSKVDDIRQLENELQSKRAIIIQLKTEQEEWKTFPRYFMETAQKVYLRSLIEEYRLKIFNEYIKDPEVQQYMSGHDKYQEIGEPKYCRYHWQIREFINPMLRFLLDKKK